MISKLKLRVYYDVYELPVSLKEAAFGATRVVNIRNI
jgi:hypothetical protein